MSSHHRKHHLVACEDLAKPKGPIETGVGFLDHMIDQLNSHAQVGVALVIGDSLAEDSRECDGRGSDDEGASGGGGSVLHSGTGNPSEPSAGTSHHSSRDRARTNRHKDDQARLLALAGRLLGAELQKILVGVAARSTSTFSCPLDEALVECCIEKQAADGTSGSTGTLKSYTLPPYGKYRRERLGSLETRHLQLFWSSLASSSGLNISLTKVRGNNAHHVVESSFKAFSRALRNLLDGVVDTDSNSPALEEEAETKGPGDSDALARRYGPSSDNWKAGIALDRRGCVSRETKETSIRVALALDGGGSGTGVRISTGVRTLDRFLTELARSARVSLAAECSGDLWIDEHHTAEDVSIALGQAVDQALGTKAGLNRMWSCRASEGRSVVQVTMDLSNRPDLVHDLFSAPQPGLEMAGDLSLEMFEHVLESLVVNARMTVHVVQVESSDDCDPVDTILATARALGAAFFYCASVDLRRAGATASSKGTLSV